MLSESDSINFIFKKFFKNDAELQNAYKNKFRKSEYKAGTVYHCCMSKYGHV